MNILTDTPLWSVISQMARTSDGLPAPDPKFIEQKLSSLKASREDRQYVMILEFVSPNGENNKEYIGCILNPQGLDTFFSFRTKAEYLEFMKTLPESYIATNIYPLAPSDNYHDIFRISSKNVRIIIHNMVRQWTLQQSLAADTL